MPLTRIVYRLFQYLWHAWPFKKPTVLFLRQNNFIPEKFRRDFWFSGTFEVPCGDGSLKLVAARNDHSSLSVFWTGLENGWDAQSIKAWSRLAANSEVIMDIGANIGLYALTASLANPAAIIHAFEPGRKAFDTLRKNVHLNQRNICLHDVAISDQNGMAAFHDLDVPTAIASLKSDELEKAGGHHILYDVQVRRLDHFMMDQNLRSLDLLSIDVEMNEPEVLEGMGPLIEKFRPDVVIEVLNDRVGSKIESYFRHKDYLYFQIDERKGLLPSAHLDRHDGPDKKSGFNFLICKKERVHLLRELIKEETIAENPHPI